MKVDKKLYGMSVVTTSLLNLEPSIFLNEQSGGLYVGKPSSSAPTGKIEHKVNTYCTISTVD